MTITTHRGTRPRAGRVARFSLDVAEWLVLRAALLRHVPGAATPPAFDPETFGVDPAAPLDEDERRRAWSRLRDRGLATTVPAHDDPAGLAPGGLAGLAILLEADVRVDVQAWSGAQAVTQAVAWSGRHAAALVRRRRRATVEGRPAAEQESVVELSLSTAGPVAEVLRALPRTPATAGPVDPSPVEVGWRESAAVVGALRSGRGDVAAHLGGLSSHELEVLGALSTTVTGGASVSGRRRLGARLLGFRRVWLWTEADVVDLVTATEETVTLRRTGTRHLRTDLLTAVTALAHATEDA